MGTLIEEIFSHRVGRPVEPGEILIVDLDHIMSHDNTTPLAIKAFREIASRSTIRTRSCCFSTTPIRRPTFWPPRTTR